ncbi:MAG: MFS transporter [Gammaproteobacteria bacterium]|nr:MFS transporter [Gammaproteobacteria bacterium]
MVATARPSLALLGLASLLSPFGMVVVVPTLAAVASYYHVDQGQAQYLIATYLFGLGIGQPVVGALSDRFGRRPVMLAGFSLFTLASLGCMFSPDFSSLSVMRILQAMGVSVGTVGSRAIVRDTHEAFEAVKALSWIGAAMGVAPVVGPVIGGVLGAWAGPPAVFAASALLGFGVTIAIGMQLEETHSVPIGEAPAGAGWVRHYRELLGARVFMGYTLMYAFVQGCFFAFLAVGAIVFEEHLGLGQQAFGLIWGAMGLLFIAGATLAGPLSSAIGVMPLLRRTTLTFAAAGLALALIASLFGVGLAGLLLPLAVMMLMAGIQTPLVTAGTVNYRPDIAGTASGLSSSLGLVLSGSFSIFAGVLYADSFSRVAWLIAVAATGTALAWWMTARP